MAEQKSPAPTSSESQSILKNPQVIAAIIGGIVTIVVAIVGLVPVILQSQQEDKEATPLVVTATTPPPQDVVVASSIATQSPTTVSSPIPTAALTQTPAPSANVLLLYDDVSLTVLNQSSAVVSLEGVTFRSGSGQWEARSWGTAVYTSLPAGKCLRLRDATAGQRNPPAACGDPLYGLQLAGTSALFWRNVDTFEIIRNGDIIVVCTVADSSCAAYIG